jgi:hypothetical protein
VQPASSKRPQGAIQWISQDEREGLGWVDAGQVLGDSNTIPENLDDASGALFERSVTLVTARDTIPEEERDYNLQTKLLAEMSGIVRWALDGLAEIEKEEAKGFHQSQLAIQKKMEIYEDPFQDFAEDEMEVIPGEWEFRHAIVEAANSWFARQNLRSPTAKKLWARLQDILPEMEMSDQGRYCDDTGRTERIVVGVKLRPTDVPPELLATPKDEERKGHTSYTPLAHRRDRCDR